jgi:hypothetical protein
MIEGRETMARFLIKETVNFTHEIEADSLDEAIQAWDTMSLNEADEEERTEFTCEPLDDDDEGDDDN